MNDSIRSQRGLKLAIGQDALDGFCARHHIRRISLFGSALRGEDSADSDIDLLVEFEPSKTPGYLALAGMEAELSDLLGGRTVDLRTQADLSRYFRDDVLSEAELQHWEWRGGSGPAPERTGSPRAAGGPGP